ncbi:hypothetical protein H0H93_002062 [Arthromyces matolae]|nr:hypothetical protein H0H93_002062 [Arthromyces matolae]
MLGEVWKALRELLEYVNEGDGVDDDVESGSEEYSGLAEDEPKSPNANGPRKPKETKKPLTVEVNVPDTALSKFFAYPIEESKDTTNQPFRKELLIAFLPAHTNNSSIATFEHESKALCGHGEGEDGKEEEENTE